ncbi:flavin-containing monooxygenase [Halopseudomonas yangmingensis]|uniref:Predicted flavoprotein CzcO associated with the cation diffusion facilitator CzcD n=1 Tax=Halopseudomonas yangmingensis TaxID=1720063 RepID=A0A1I4TMY7_9GAMM|nr:NAD(P)/FAD-dependent oxidoreductase [Halopseudomonas yangmingensis]SFM77917.1 Predicted flavoprotein CzcO associated with the cation diffusion facilitator CzcD [Halopseudomonas yangmingensis]
MSAAQPHAEQPLDVLIVGAGLSGIGAACRLRQQCPDKQFLIIEARDAIGGTWDLFRYPGIRSDSDMYTLSYDFKPWANDKSIADGPDIRTYINEAADEHQLREQIRFGQRVERADWSSSEACWTLEISHRDSQGQPARYQLRSRFLYLCSGYYSYDQAYRPHFPGEEGFNGPIVHPQFWPEALDYRDKRVVVIGSGATAFSLVRWKNILTGIFYYRLARRRPGLFRKRLIEMAASELGPDINPAHFSPAYQPWDQRICVAPDGDLFKDIREGRASVVTDQIDRITSDGIRLASGASLPADIIVVATGLQLNAFGDIRLGVDGKAVEPAQTMAYKGMMLSDIPNCAMAFGYVNSSWTLKADLTADYVCRLLKHMDQTGMAIAVAERDSEVSEQPFLSFTSGYVQRASGLLPKQGDRIPWQVYQNYLQDRRIMRNSPIDDGVLRFYSASAVNRP